MVTLIRRGPDDIKRRTNMQTTDQAIAPDFHGLDATSPTKDLLETFNILRQRADLPILKKWTASKADLIKRIKKLDQELIERNEAESQGPRDLDKTVKELMTEAGMLAEKTQELLQETPSYFDHDAAIAFIRKHRRRRTIYIRIGCTSHDDYPFSGYLTVSAMDARRYVTILFGNADTKKLPNLKLKIVISPDKVPVGSKTPGTMHVG